MEVVGLAGIMNEVLRAPCPLWRELLHWITSYLSLSIEEYLHTQ